MLWMQAAAEYVGVALQGAVRFLTQGAERAFTFVSTPRGVLVAAGIVVLLALTVGRRRRL